MTREEAIKILENGGWWDLLIPITTIEGRSDEDKLHQAIDMAISALRPVSWEQLEKVWRGEWQDTREAYNDVPKRRCSRCKSVFIGLDTPFCEVCGAPMTDEAVEMVMERMDELQNEIG